jgi:hypothetical protein
MTFEKSLSLPFKGRGRGRERDDIKVTIENK